MSTLISRLWRRFFTNSTLQPKTPYGLSGPTVPHRRMIQAELAGKRLFVVGDVHGCHDELLRLLEEADALRSDVQVILVGDLINKGPKNVECVELARRIGALCVRGNHDDVALSVLQKSRAAGQALPEKMSWLSGLSEESEKWLLELPYTIYFPWLNVLVVHAGLVPGVPLSRQTGEDMLHMRNLLWDESSSTYSASRRADTGDAWAKVWPGPMHIYFGHDARRKLQRERFATGLDTGCVYGGSLIGMYIGEGASGEGTGRVYTVKAAAVYRQP